MSLIESADAELKRANFAPEDRTVLLNILRQFFDQFDSGGAVAAVQPVLNKLIAGKPISPLTGDPDEWVDHGNGVFQNSRCGSVFKDPRFHDGKLAYDIDAPEPRAAISFPYEPPGEMVKMPIITFG